MAERMRGSQADGRVRVREDERPQSQGPLTRCCSGWARRPPPVPPQSACSPARSRSGWRWAAARPGACTPRKTCRCLRAVGRGCKGCEGLHGRSWPRRMHTQICPCSSPTTITHPTTHPTTSGPPDPGACAPCVSWPLASPFALGLLSQQAMRENMRGRHQARHSGLEGWGRHLP